MTRGRTLGMVIAAVVALMPDDVAAQEWRGSAQIGRVPSSTAPAGAGSGSSAVLGISRGAPRYLVGISTALPVNGEPFWVTVGGWKRVATTGRVGVFADLSAHGFIQRYATSGSTVPAPSPVPTPAPPTGGEYQVSGMGVGGEAMAGVRADVGALRLEARGGAAARRSELGDNSTERFLPAADARVAVVRLPFVLQAETRGWWNTAERHAYAGGTARVASGPAQLWGSAGRWLDGGVSGLVWAAGAGVDIGPRLSLLLTARSNTFDPLYLTTTETSVAAGMSVRFGRGAATVRAPVPAVYRNGRAEVGVPARGITGTPSIAGDFTEWRPVPMVRDGGRWVWRGALEPGTYNYAFVTEDGTWFVPESVPGRRSDGMGGHVAVLVVTS